MASDAFLRVPTHRPNDKQRKGFFPEQRLVSAVSRRHAVRQKTSSVSDVWHAPSHYVLSHVVSAAPWLWTLKAFRQNADAYLFHWLSICTLARIHQSPGMEGLRGMTVTRTATGYITVVQEQRFRITTDSGHSFLFTLAGNAPLHLSDLNRLQQAHTHVSVAYTGDPNLTSGVAHAVQPLAGWQ